MQSNIKLEKLIEEKINDLSAQEKKVGDFILKHPEGLLQMSVQEASEKTGVSQATVVRFCKSLGFKGMKELKIAMGGIHSAPEEHTTPLSWDDTPLEVTQKSVYQAGASIDDAFSLNGTDVLQEISTVIAASPSLDIIGIGGSATVANYAKTEFMRLGKRTESFTDHFLIYQLTRSASTITPLLAISCSGETAEVVDAVKEMKAKGAYIIGITGQKDSTLANEADAVIYTPRSKIFLDDKDAFSRISQLTIITTLYLMTAIEMGKNNPDFKSGYVENTNYRSIGK